jgi:CxxC motif-containing protein
MEERNLTCINCPMGCSLTVTLENGEVTSVTGNTCKRGEIYGKKEVTNPSRIVTSSVRVKNGDIPMVSCKAASDIPKGKILEITRAITNLEVEAPVSIGDVLLENVCDTGVNIIATKNINLR